MECVNPEERRDASERFMRGRSGPSAMRNSADPGMLRAVAGRLSGLWRRLVSRRQRSSQGTNGGAGIGLRAVEGSVKLGADTLLFGPDTMDGAVEKASSRESPSQEACVPKDGLRPAAEAKRGWGVGGSEEAGDLSGVLDGGSVGRRASVAGSTAFQLGVRQPLVDALGPGPFVWDTRNAWVGEPSSTSDGFASGPVASPAMNLGAGIGMRLNRGQARKGARACPVRVDNVSRLARTGLGQTPKAGSSGDWVEGVGGARPAGTALPAGQRVVPGPSGGGSLNLRDVWECCASRWVRPSRRVGPGSSVAGGSGDRGRLPWTREASGPGSMAVRNEGKGASLRRAPTAPEILMVARIFAMMSKRLLGNQGTDSARWPDRTLWQEKVRHLEPWAVPRGFVAPRTPPAYTRRRSAPEARLTIALQDGLVARETARMLESPEGRQVIVNLVRQKLGQVRPGTAY